MPFLNGSESYPPAATGENKSKTEIAVYNSNLVDSVAPADLSTFVVAKHNSNGFFPNPIYDTGFLSIDPTEVKLTNNGLTNFSFIVLVRSSFSSDSTSNTANLGIRLNSTGGVGTSTEEIKSAGPTAGSATVAATLGTFGAFTLAPSESVWLEVAKSYSGTCVMDKSLFVILPLW